MQPVKPGMAGFIGETQTRNPLTYPCGCVIASWMLLAINRLADSLLAIILFHTKGVKCVDWNDKALFTVHFYHHHGSMPSKISRCSACAVWTLVFHILGKILWREIWTGICSENQAECSAKRSWASPYCEWRGLSKRRPTIQNKHNRTFLHIRADVFIGSSSRACMTNIISCLPLAFPTTNVLSFCK